MNYLFGLIGHPVGHSLSPWIHEHFFEQSNIKGIYRAIPTPMDELDQIISGLRFINIDGFNVTVPYKEKIISYLDEMDPYAEKMGAVNTVKKQDGKWIGYNTDGRGYLRSLMSEYPHLKEDTAVPILILGAGGAARGIYRALIEAGFSHIDIANRTITKAEALLKLQEPNVKTTIKTLTEMTKSTADYSLIIQTSSVGMKPNIENQIIQLDKLSTNTVVSDIVYQPIKTKFLQSAEENGGHIHHGHGMLLHQAALAFEIWTGHRVKVDNLVNKLEQRLRGDKKC